MKIQLNTGLFQIFSGTYESPWEITDYDENGTEELDVTYDFQDFMKGIARAYESESINMMYFFKEYAPFVKKIHFQGTFASPREYNFSTDVLDFEITVSKKELMSKLDELRTNKAFSDFLWENYRSRDGFISFTPSHYDDLREQIETEGDEYAQSIGALLSFLMNEDTRWEIEESVLESWRGNGYGGTHYTSKPYEKFQA